MLDLIVLALQTDLTPRQRDYLEKIDTSAKALLGLINDILDFSKIEAGKLDIDETGFQLQEVLEDIADLFEGMGACRKVSGTDELVVTVSELLTDATESARLGRAGQQVLEDNRGALERLLVLLEPLLEHGASG